MSLSPSTTLASNGFIVFKQTKRLQLTLSNRKWLPTAKIFEIEKKKDELNMVKLDWETYI